MFRLRRSASVLLALATAILVLPAQPAAAIDTSCTAPMGTGSESQCLFQFAGWPVVVEATFELTDGFIKPQKAEWELHAEILFNALAFRPTLYMECEVQSAGTTAHCRGEFYQWAPGLPAGVGTNQAGLACLGHLHALSRPPGSTSYGNGSVFCSSGPQG